jgi:glycosyltransferase involved in cell wall biosynthesis
MRILIAGQTYRPAFNGQAVFTTNLAEGLTRNGHDVTVLLPSDRVVAYTRRQNGVQLHYLPSLPLWIFHSDANTTLFVRTPVEEIFSRFQPQVVHVQDHYPLSQTVAGVARRFRTPVIGTNHFMPENLAPYFPFSDHYKGLFDWLMWKPMIHFFNGLSLATAPSETAARILRKQGLRAPVCPVSCGVSLERFYLKPDLDQAQVRERFGLDSHRTIFLFVGRVDVEKRLDVLLRACHLMQRDDIQLAIAGRGEALEELKRLAQRLDLGERVRFLGFVPDADLPALLNSVDIFAMPSEAELLSIATLEAMAAGRPVLAANAQALPELVAPGRNGFLFRPGDPVDAALYMAKLADHPEQWPEMSKVSQAKARAHSLEHTIAQYEGLYRMQLVTAQRSHQRASDLNHMGLGSRPSWSRIQHVVDYLRRQMV